MNTPLIDFAPKAVATIVKCQEILAEYIVPDSGISDHGCINRLLGVLDDQNLVKEMRANGLLPQAKINKGDFIHEYWPSSLNIERTSYHAPSKTMEFEYKETGRVYQYFDVPKEVWDQLVEAPSIGSFIAREMKGKFRYCRV